LAGQRLIALASVYSASDLFFYDLLAAIFGPIVLS
jgi:hypothetical protein